jgi:ATP-dependent Clp protease protease subunit
MNKDFRNYATKHLGMNGMVLDDVVRAQAQYLNPYILEERQLNVTQMDVFSRLMMDRIIFLGTEIDDYTANTLQAQLLYLDSVDSGKDISIYINSPGGSVTAGLGIYDTMQFISSDVATICTGMAASMAAVLLVSGQEGKRSALTHSRVMIHQPLGGVQGKASDIKLVAEHIIKLKEKINKILSKNTKQNINKIIKDTECDNYMDSKEALNYGLIDEII